jgi:hypothetical protein
VQAPPDRSGARGSPRRRESHPYQSISSLIHLRARESQPSACDAFTAGRATVPLPRLPAAQTTNCPDTALPGQKPLVDTSDLHTSPSPLHLLPRPRPSRTSHPRGRLATSIAVARAWQIPHRTASHALGRVADRDVASSRFTPAGDRESRDDLTTFQK